MKHKWYIDISTTGEPYFKVRPLIDAALAELDKLSIKLGDVYYSYWGRPEEDYLKIEVDFENGWTLFLKQKNVCTENENMHYSLLNGEEVLCKGYDELDYILNHEIIPRLEK